MDEFVVRPVDRRTAQSVETIGSKPKFWFVDGDRNVLFKADDRGTGEDWAEVVVCHLCSLIGLPHVHYDLAAEFDGSQYLRPGVICANMSPAPMELVHGNELLHALDPLYPKQSRYRVNRHTVSAVCDALATLTRPADEWMSGVPNGISTALDVFIGYVMLDAWVANQDRHHENWGAIRDKESLRLAPSFDHGASLARNLTDRDREERLRTKDKNRTVAAFAAKGRGALYGTERDARPLGLSDCFSAVSIKSAAASKAWLDQLVSVQFDSIQDIVNRVPEDRMSKICKEFTLELLSANRKRLLSQ